MTHGGGGGQRRYGTQGPHFARTSLADALAYAQAKRQPLLVYLHDDRVLEAQLFCTEVLCHALVAAVLNANFVAWGCDVTRPHGRDRLKDECARVHGCVGVTCLSGLGALVGCVLRELVHGLRVIPLSLGKLPCHPLFLLSPSLSRT